jgi:hypothetical protein
MSTLVCAFAAGFFSSQDPVISHGTALQAVPRGWPNDSTVADPVADLGRVTFQA